ncbi:hypothetical protein APHAL10511_005672 [Amanita phalloides]|nr:hypothetical protein APHAL10511_005672 [Amanita phalloides]
MSHLLQQRFFGQVYCPWFWDATSNKATILVSLFVIFLVSRIIRYYQGLKVVNNHPGFRVPFDPLSLLGIITPRTWWNPGHFFTWHDRLQLYEQYGTDTISVVPFVYGSPSFYTSNLEIIRQIAPSGPNAGFIKPLIGSRALLLWGMNIFSANGETWRRHRRVTGPAFNNNLYAHVFDKSVAMYHSMVISEKWTSREEVDIPVFQDLSRQFTLLIIQACGFGVNFDWTTASEDKDGSMSLWEAMGIVADSTLVATIAPWLMALPFARFRKMRAAYKMLEGFMKEQTAERKHLLKSNAGESELGKDVFTLLVQANEDESAKHKLNDRELIGNVYVMLFAGHETTATALAATIGFMALHQDIQHEILEQIELIVGSDRNPTFEDYPKLNKVHAALLEAIRMFPPGFVLIRQAVQDTVFKVQNPACQDGLTTLPIRKGTMVIANIIGLQYNSKYYDEPEKYKPSRWYGLETESEAFTGFSIGARACIGRKFATTEGVAFLTMLLRDWHIAPLLRPEENKENWRARVLDAKVVLTLQINDVAVKLTKRQR